MVFDIDVMVLFEVCVCWRVSHWIMVWIVEDEVFFLSHC